MHVCGFPSLPIYFITSFTYFICRFYYCKNAQSGLVPGKIYFITRFTLYAVTLKTVSSVPLMRHRLPITLSSSYLVPLILLILPPVVIYNSLNLYLDLSLIKPAKTTAAPKPQSEVYLRQWADQVSE